MRSTRQREVILEVIRSTMTHPTADWVYRQVRRRLPRISLGTVYRNLKLLQQTGRVSALRHGRQPTRYEAALERHYHIRCIRCGLLEDLAMAPRRRLERDAARVSRYEVWDHTVDVIGVCPRCRQRAGGHKRTRISLLTFKKETSHGESSSSSRGAGRDQRQ